MSIPVAAMALALTGARSFADSRPFLEGRAVLPVETLAPGPPSGTLLVPCVGNMPDNGFGAKATSKDFLLRAYYVALDFKTARGGTGGVEVRDFISFRDPDGKIGFPIVNEDTAERELTGFDLDPESLQRDHRGDLWMGDEFGPWILHFDATGRLLDAPYGIDVRSPNNPFLAGLRRAGVEAAAGAAVASSTPAGADVTGIAWAPAQRRSAPCGPRRPRALRR